MWLKQAADLIRIITYPIIKVCNGIGAWSLMAVTILTTIDVCLRYLLARPIRGTYEVTEFMLCVLVFFGLAYTAVRKGHVSVSLVVSRLPRRARSIVDSITHFLSMGLICIMAWRGFMQAKIYWHQNLTSAILHVPVFPFLCVVAFGCAMLFLILLADFFESLSQVVTK
ncbi:MAG: TRAP transporter small permease [Thermodesulfobacteriota bacterium]|nr:TRAP transporter small permease [Thermodesulfobacteriota bacterium]